jgi:hypothetical protein
VRGTRTADARLILWALLTITLSAGCYPEPVAITTFPPTDQPSFGEQPTGQPSPGSSATDQPIQPTPTSGLTFTDVAPDCVNGWAAAEEGTAEFGTAMYLIERQMEIVGPWTVDEVRYFTGPDVFWAEAPYPVVERWYVKASRAEDARFAGRWLIEKRSDFDFGVVAVAPYDSDGYQTPDWTGFVGDGTPTTYLGLPGQWTGTPYDFVSGAGYNEQPGLPDEVIGCLADT